MASMSRSSLRAEVIRLGRVGSNVSSTVLNNWLYEAVKMLQNDLLWLEKSRVYYVREYFSVATDEGFGIRLDSATGEVQLLGVTTAQTDVSGKQLATALEAEWNSTHWGTATGIADRSADTGIAVDYSTSTRKFTVTSQAASYSSTGITILAPLYAGCTGAIKYSLTHKLFGITDGQASASTYAYTGAAAPHCQAEYPLPDDFLKVKEIRYGAKSYPLRPEIYKGRNFTGTGTPSHYYIRDNYLGLTPEPTQGGEPIQLDYFYLPADFSTDLILHPFPEIFDYALIWYTIGLYRDSLMDTAGMLKAMARYEDFKVKGVQRKRGRQGAVNLFDRGGYKTRYDPRNYNL